LAAADGALLDLTLPLFETVDVKSVLPAAVEAFTPACRARPSNSRADSVGLNGVGRSRLDTRLCIYLDLSRWATCGTRMAKAAQDKIAAGQRSSY